MKRSRADFEAPFAARARLVKSLPEQLLARARGVQGAIAFPSSFRRRVAFEALVPRGAGARLVLLGFSRDGEWLLGTMEAAPSLLAWPLAVSTATARPLTLSDASRVLPLPKAASDVEVGQEEQPQRLRYVESRNACALFATTFADADGCEWRVSVSRRPDRDRDRDRDGASRGDGASVASASACRGAEAPNEASLRDAAGGGVLVALNCGDVVRFLSYRPRDGAEAAAGGGGPPRASTRPTLSFDADGAWWNARPPLAASGEGPLELAAQRSLDLEAFLATNAARFRRGPTALVDYCARLIPADASSGDASDVCHVALAWRARPVRRRLAAPSADDLSTAALLRVDVATGAVGVLRLVDVARVDAPLAAAATALAAAAPPRPAASRNWVLDNDAFLAGRPVAVLDNPAYPVSVVAGAS